MNNKYLTFLLLSVTLILSGSLLAQTSWHFDATTNNEVVDNTSDVTIIKGSSDTSLGIRNVTRNLVIVEDFTATWCGYCPVAAKACDDLVENGHPVGVIAYHGSDDYTNPDSEYRIDYYDIIGFPTVYIDGVIETGVSGDDMYSLYLMYVNQRLAITTPITVELTNVVYSGNTFTADVVCEAVGSVTNSDLVLHASISESHIPEVWMDDTQELNFVERQMFPDAQGTSIDLVNNTQQTVSIEFILDDTWVPELCEVVVFVQDVSDKEIYNADKVEVEELTELPDATVYVTDVDGVPIEGAIVDFGDFQDITNAVGEVVFVNLEPGPYWYNAIKEGSLPINDSCVVMQVEDKDVFVTLHLANLLFSEDFSGNFPPEGWTLEGDQIENWSQFNSNYAGGIAPELEFNWTPAFIGYSECISPFFDISTAANAHLILKNTAHTYSEEHEFSLSIMASPDGNNWNTLQEMISPINITAVQVIFELGDEYLVAGQVKVKFRFQGDSDGLYEWDIDDVWIVEEVVNTSIEEMGEDNILIYPNPATEEINVIVANNADIKIYNIRGQLVLEEYVVEGAHSLDISYLENGTYLVRIINNEMIITSKVIIVK